jgi:hypothetical protein
MHGGMNFFTHSHLRRNSTTMSIVRMNAEALAEDYQAHAFTTISDELGSWGTTIGPTLIRPKLGDRLPICIIFGATSLQLPSITLGAYESNESQ